MISNNGMPPPLLEGDSDKFHYSIGGLIIGVENRIQQKLKSGGEKEFIRFLCSPAQAKADICIDMEYSFEQCVVEYENPVVVDHSFRIYAQPEGYYVLRYRSKQQQSPYVIIRADHQFTHFHHCFCSDSVKPQPVNYYWSAADALLLQHSFINHQGLVIHAGGGSIQGKGMVFAGPSGAGKSTLSDFLSLSPKNQLFSDERLVVRFSDERWNVWGTPWQGSGNIARNATTPLSALVFLKQGETTQITELTPSQGLHRLLQVVSIPWYSEEWTHKGLAVCEPLVQEIPMFELTFRADESAVQAVEELALGLA